MIAKPMCRHCSNSVLHRSHRKGWKDSFMRLLGFSPMRCHDCNGRFYVRAAKSSDAQSASSGT